MIGERKTRLQLLEDIGEGARRPGGRLTQSQKEQVASVQRPQLQADIAESMSSVVEIKREDERR